MVSATALKAITLLTLVLLQVPIDAPIQIGADANCLAIATVMLTCAGSVSKGTPLAVAVGSLDSLEHTIAT